MQLLCAFILVTAVSASIDDLELKWGDYKTEHKKAYSVSEDQRREGVFNESIAYCKTHNELYVQGKVLFDVKMTSRADSLPSDNAGFDPQNREPARYKFDWRNVDQERIDDLPNYVNWAEKGLIGRVYDQVKCGCCYAFTATQTIESQWKLLYNVSVQMSNKMILDCTRSYGNQGCKGGLMSNTFKFIKDNGIAMDKDYPFVAEEEPCQTDVKRFNVSLYTHVDIHPDEDLIKVAVARGGPVAVGVYSRCKPFQLYSEGIFDCTNCPAKGLDHALVIYGYGTTTSGVDYWLAKNAWGEEWGERGHCKIIRGRNCLNLRALPSIPFISEKSFKQFMGFYNTYLHK